MTLKSIVKKKIMTQNVR